MQYIPSNIDPVIIYFEVHKFVLNQKWRWRTVILLWFFIYTQLDILEIILSFSFDLLF